jgi:hypothetical protein
VRAGDVVASPIEIWGWVRGKTPSLGFPGGGGYDQSNFWDGVEENCEL